jgi:hypothetical protein
MNRCEHCPLPLDRDCKGQKFPRFCDLVNPNHPQFDIRYRQNLDEEHQNIYPSLLQQTKNAVVTVGSVVASIVRGEPVSVPQEEQDRRLAICHACEYWDAAQGRCSKCGCFGAWKTWLASQRCPIGKW